MRFGTDGVRGAANTELTPAFALRLGAVAARVLGVGHAVVGGDTRSSTPMFAHALAAGLASAGVDVRMLGVVPTPAVAFECARADDDTLGVVVSASHNPYPDNGIKLFAPGGLKLSDAVQTEIEAALDAAQGADVGAASTASAASVGTIVGDVHLGAYCEHLLGALDGRTLAGLRVVVDAANGAAFQLAPTVLEAAGADVVAIHVEPDGTNINELCGATAPESLAAAVLCERAHLGLALDGDADRLIAVDERGQVIDGDHILAICATELQRRGVLRDDAVVVTVMTNLGFHLAMAEAGIDVVETAVGDRYVLEALEHRGYSLGGEQSGHVIFRDVSTTGDGTLTGLVLADIVASSGGTLAALAGAAMTSLPQVLVNVPVADAALDWASMLGDGIAAVEGELGDHGRVLVRPSGTEPVVRVMVEAPTADAAESAAGRLVELIGRLPAAVPPDRGK